MATLIAALIAPFTSRLWTLLRKSFLSSTATLVFRHLHAPRLPVPYQRVHLRFQPHQFVENVPLKLDVDCLKH
jgi:hypothetical protein